MIENFNLTEKDIEKGIENCLKDIDNESTKSLNPKYIVICAGPGAGKTGIEKLREKEFNEIGEKPAILGADKVSKYHPYYEEALKKSPEECYKITREFIRPAMPIIFTKVKERGISILNERALNKGKRDYDLINELKEAGYKIIVDIMATDELISRLSCYERAANELKKGISPRGVSEKTHQEMYNGFVPEVYTLMQKGMCDQVNVFTRGEKENEPKLIFQEGNKNYRDFNDALISERLRQRREILKNADAYLERIEIAIEKIKKYSKDDSDSHQELLIGLNNLKEKFLQELQIQKDAR